MKRRKIESLKFNKIKVGLIVITAISFILFAGHAFANHDSDDHHTSENRQCREIKQEARVDLDRIQDYFTKHHLLQSHEYQVALDRWHDKWDNKIHDACWQHDGVPTPTPTPDQKQCSTPTPTPNITPTPTEKLPDNNPSDSTPNTPAPTDNSSSATGSSTGSSNTIADDNRPQTNSAPDTSCPIFDAPALQSAQALGNGSVSYTWSPIEGVDKYSITYGYSTDNLIYGEDNIPATSTSIILNSLTTGKNIWAQVWAWKNGCAQTSNLLDPLVR